MVGEFAQNVGRISLRINSHRHEADRWPKIRIVQILQMEKTHLRDRQRTNICTMGVKELCDPYLAFEIRKADFSTAPLDEREVRHCAVDLQPFEALLLPPTLSASSSLPDPDGSSYDNHRHNR